MFRFYILTALTLALGLAGGCQSAEEECNEARVAAHGAWTAFEPLCGATHVHAETLWRTADATTLRHMTGSRTALTPTERELAPLGETAFDLSSKLGDLCEAVGPTKAAMRGGAIPARDQVGRVVRLLDSARGLATGLVEQGTGIPAAQEHLSWARSWANQAGGDPFPRSFRVAVQASDRHWEACQNVDP